MKQYKKACWNIAKKRSNKLNEMEDKLAMEWYGCKFEELDEDERGEISFEVHDMLGY